MSSPVTYHRPQRGEDRERAVDGFLAKCKAEGISNTDGMRLMIRAWAGVTEPAPPVGDAGSAAEVLSVS